jgi:Domain of unknown function (DUF4034)
VKGISTESREYSIKPLYILFLCAVVIFLFYHKKLEDKFLVEKNYKQSFSLNRDLASGEILNFKIRSIKKNEKFRVHRCNNVNCSRASTKKIWDKSKIKLDEVFSYYVQNSSHFYFWLENTDKSDAQGAVVIQQGRQLDGGFEATFSSGTVVIASIAPSSESIVSVFLNIADEGANIVFQAVNSWIIGGEVNHYSQKDLSQVNVYLSATPKASFDEIEILKKLLKNQQFSQLDNKIKGLYQSYILDISLEQKVTSILGKIVTSDPSGEEILNNFCDELPDSYVPYLLRGIYYNYKGWNSRGKKWVKNTTKNQIKGMHEYFQLSQHDMKKALSFESNLVHAYLYLINTSYHSSDDLAKNFYDQGIKMRPESFSLRWWYQSTLLPRWGGSYIEMDHIAENAKKYVDKNPMMPVLFGRKFKDISAIKRKKYGDYQGAIANAEKAMMFGRYAPYLESLAYIYFQQEDYRKALPLYDAVVQQEPLSRRPLEMRATIHLRSGDYQNCVKDMDLVFKLGGVKAGNYLHRANCHKGLGRHQQAVNDYYMAELLDVSDGLGGLAENHIKYYKSKGFEVNSKIN